MPHNPKTTLGTAASNSIIQPSGRRSHEGTKFRQENTNPKTDGKRDQNGRSGSNQRSINKRPSLELIRDRIPHGIQRG